LPAPTETRALRRVLMVSPHFPPDTSAGTHRVRLLAPHLPDFGWEPVVVSVDADGYEGAIDPGLLSLVPPEVRIVRSRAWSPRWTRMLGIGDLGIRAFAGLRRTCESLLASERFDALFITIYPTYPALIGPMLKRRFHVPFVLDYQDPWIGAWGDTVGAGSHGSVDLKSRVSRWIAGRLEPRAVSAADALTAVSAPTYEAVAARYPGAAPSERATLPIGGESSDFDALPEATANRYFDARDGFCHISYVGALLPLGVDTIRVIFKAAALLKARRPDLYARLRLHFFGTSNQTGGDPAAAVYCATPLAREAGVDDCMTELPIRVPYLEALAIQRDSQGLLMTGSSERHYTASKIYPSLLARRPLLAVYHQASSVVTTMKEVGGEPSIRLVAFDDRGPEQAVERVYDALEALIASPCYDATVVNLDALQNYSARAIAGRLASTLDRISGHAR
jgi:hypothetical protein